MSIPRSKRESGRHPLPEGLGKDISEAWNQAVRGFSLAFACRSSLSVLLRILQLVRSGRLGHIFSIENVFSEKTLIVRVEAVRIGLAVGCFSGGYRLITKILERFRGISDGMNSLISGFFSGISLLYLNVEDRRMVSLYALARVAQCVYNLLKARGMWHFWGSDWNHGDTLLFATTSAQIMYAYVMRPKSLPSSYYKFIQRTGPISEEVLEAVRAVNRGQFVDPTPVLAYVKATNPLSPVTSLSTHPDIIGCDLLHPVTSSCTYNSLRVLLSAFKKIFPIYGSLSLISVVIVGFVKFVLNPVGGLYKVVQSTFQSTLFLSSLVALYQSIVCIQRKFVCAISSRVR
eukprot:TRINITY_DN2405_c0_g2_i15.p1 TRINITY_DN2405_c0_g2~~TRINITY_DN2405_c0_g2_i15.p1  ORF type:complete len:345 (+),score=57.11 TRINITY_DN2405_c0_g2_i15:68-1102(+)